MKYASLSVAVVTLLSAIAVASAAAQEYTPDSTPPKRVVMPRQVEVPLLQANDRDSRAQVAVMVNGKGPYQFDVETGAREIDVSPELARSLNLTRTGGPDSLPEYHVDSMSVGAAVFHDMHVSQLPNGVNHVDGVLGLPFYQNLLLTIDYPGHQIRLSRDTLPSPNGADIIPLSRVNEFWGLPITIGGKPFIAVLDTQNSATLNLPPDVADQLSFDGGLRVVGRAIGVFGASDVKGGQLAGDVAIGRYTFPHPFLNVVELPPEFPRKANVGSRLLDNFVMSIDQRHARLRLSHPGDSVIQLPGPSVRRVTAGGASPAAAEQLRAYTGTFGDRTVSIVDGRLTLQRPNGRPNELVMTARDTFGIRDIPEAKIVFGRDASGAVTEIRVLNLQGQWETAKRGGP